MHYAVVFGHVVEGGAGPGGDTDSMGDSYIGGDRRRQED